MTATYTHEHVISRMTLAFMQDTGWVRLSCRTLLASPSPSPSLPRSLRLKAFSGFMSSDVKKVTASCVDLRVGLRPAGTDFCAAVNQRLCDVLLAVLQPQTRLWGRSFFAPKLAKNSRFPLFQKMKKSHFFSWYLPRLIANDCCCVLILNFLYMDILITMWMP